MENKSNSFIMLPTVDFCFKELMNCPKVRKGFIAALLHVKPEEVGDTMLLPCSLRQSFEDDKLGILDVRILMTSGAQLDMEMQVKYFACWDDRVLFYTSKMFSEQLKKGESYDKLKKCIHVSILDFIHFTEDKECYRTIHFRDDKTGRIYTDKMEIKIMELKKLPKEVRTGEEIIDWMRFFGGKSREEFEMMAKTNEYLNEAYNVLLHLSEDEEKRMEYEAREKALKDYNTQIGSAEQKGIEKGIEAFILDNLEEKRGEEEIIGKLQNRFSLTREKAQHYYRFFT